MEGQTNGAVQRYRQRKLNRLKQSVNDGDEIRRFKVRRAIRLLEALAQMSNNDGGPGSGNWGHAGRPGSKGGSGKGGGAHNRQKTESGGYTSFSKKKAAAAKPHKVTETELTDLPNGSIVSFGSKADGKWKKTGAFGFVNTATGEMLEDFELAEMKSQARVHLPDSANPNYLVDRQAESLAALQDRMDNAPRYESKEAIDALLRSDCGDVWNTLSDGQKYELYNYTGSSFVEINKLLRSKNSIPATSAEFETLPLKDQFRMMYAKSAYAITEAIEKTSLPDIWLQRGVSVGAAAKFLHVSSNKISKAISTGDTSKLIGISGKDKAFMSCGSTNGQGFSNSPVQFHIFCPEGTKGMYAEPFSMCGGNNGAGKNWDGRSAQPYFGNEFETILQRGTSVETLKGEVKNGILHIDCRVTSQDTFS